MGFATELPTFWTPKVQPTRSEFRQVRSSMNHSLDTKYGVMVPVNYLFNLLDLTDENGVQIQEFRSKRTEFELKELMTVRERPSAMLYERIMSRDSDSRSTADCT